MNPVTTTNNSINLNNLSTTNISVRKNSTSINPSSSVSNSNHNRTHSRGFSAEYKHLVAAAFIASPSPPLSPTSPGFRDPLDSDKHNNNSTNHNNIHVNSNQANEDNNAKTNELSTPESSNSIVLPLPVIPNSHIGTHNRSLSAAVTISPLNTNNETNNSSAKAANKSSRFSFLINSGNKDHLSTQTIIHNRAKSASVLSNDIPNRNLDKNGKNKRSIITSLMNDNHKDDTSQPKSPSIFKRMQSMLESGTIFNKYSMSGRSKPSKKRVFYQPKTNNNNEEIGALYWVEPNKSLTKHVESSKKFIEVRDISDIYLGKQTTAFAGKIGSKAVEELCFSIVASNRTLDLEAISLIEKQDFIDQLTQLISHYSKRTIAIHENKYINVNTNTNTTAPRTSIAAVPPSPKKITPSNSNATAPKPSSHAVTSTANAANNNPTTPTHTHSLHNFNSANTNSASTSAVNTTPTTANSAANNTKSIALNTSATSNANNTNFSNTGPISALNNLNKPTIRKLSLNIPASNNAVISVSANNSGNNTPTNANTNRLYGQPVTPNRASLSLSTFNPNLFYNPSPRNSISNISINNQPMQLQAGNIYNVYVSLKASNLFPLTNNNKLQSIITISYIDIITNTIQSLDSTEPILMLHSPNYSKQFVINHIHNTNQFYLISVYDVNYINSNSDHHNTNTYHDNQRIGTTIISMDQLLNTANVTNTINNEFSFPLSHSSNLYTSTRLIENQSKIVLKINKIENVFNNTNNSSSDGSLVYQNITQLQRNNNVVLRNYYNTMTEINNQYASGNNINPNNNNSNNSSANNSNNNSPTNSRRNSGGNNVNSNSANSIPITRKRASLSNLGTITNLNTNNNPIINSNSKSGSLSKPATIRHATLTGEQMRQLSKSYMSDNTANVISPNNTNTNISSSAIVGDLQSIDENDNNDNTRNELLRDIQTQIKQGFKQTQT